MNRFGGSKLRFRLCPLSLGLVKSCLKWAGADLEEQLALLDERAFLVALPHQAAGHLCSHVGVDESVKGADPLAKNRNILLLDLHDLKPPEECMAAPRLHAWGRSRQ